MGKGNNSISQFVIFIIKAYKFLLSGLLGNCCRFYPSCSTYSIDAIQSHGFLHGTYFSVKRIMRCHPWCEGGIDPVPEKSKNDVKNVR